VNAASEKIGIVLNDSPHALEGPATLMGLLSGLDLAGKRGVAAAVNGEVIPRAAWGSRILAERDRVFVIRATQGG
jgi:sulfur carrier protein